ncbi:MAG: hypothetical protein K8T25_08380 [Planctomycetia bacterium]|nr:hypothetical protein [Planctomycetia bacterium]
MPDDDPKFPVGNYFLSTVVFSILKVAAFGCFIWLTATYPATWNVIAILLFVLVTGLITSGLFFYRTYPKLCWMLSPVFGSAWLVAYGLMYWIQHGR